MLSWAYMPSRACVAADTPHLVQEVPCGGLGFERLRLSRPQQVLLAGAWRMWVRNRRAHDHRLHTALEPLSRVACVQHIHPPWLAGQHGGPTPARSRCLGPVVLELLRGGVAGPNACCVCSACAHRLSRRLLGVSMDAQASVAAALRQLRAFQARDIASVAAVINAVCMPGVFLTAEQIASQMLASIEAKIPETDWLNVCRTADCDLTRRSLMAGL